MRTQYERLLLLIDMDEIAFDRLARSKPYYKAIAHVLREPGVAVCFVESSDAAASLVLHALARETERGHFIPLDGDLVPALEQPLAVLGAVPGLTLPMALRLMHAFSSLRDVLTRCVC